MMAGRAILRVLLVDDHAVFRESVAGALAAHSDLAVEHCASIAEAVRAISRAGADVVLLDHDLGAERSWQFFEAVERIGFRGRVLIVTAWVGESEVRRLLKLGAAGIFCKENPLHTLLGAIRAVARGEIWLDERYLAGSSNNLGAPGQGAWGHLSEKERRVLRFVLEGLSNKDIGWRLSISESYVKAILQRLFQQTGVRTRGQLVRIVLERYDDQI